ncbi:MAG: hypothetical protein CME06_09970 [Gemmatimonadetes bacterium]|nr:hypothetical protein [Gemmatimonadota bacterium]
MRGIERWTGATLAVLAATMPARGAAPARGIDGTHVIERAMGGRGAIADILDEWRRSPAVERLEAGRCTDGADTLQSQSFNIFDLSDFNDLGGVDIDCTLVRKTEHAFIYVETSLWGGALIDDSVIDSFVELFESSTPAVADPPHVLASVDPSAGIFDILETELRPLPDSNDPRDVDGLDRIYVVFVDIPDSYRRAGDVAVNGYFSSVNELCDAEFKANYGAYVAKGLGTNEKEMLVLDIDPSLGTGFLDIVRGVPAHELQHLLHWFADERESTWLDEGIADLSAELVGFPPVGHYDAFLDDHDASSLALWEQEQRDYGHASLFMRYLADHPPAEAAVRWGNMEAVRKVMASTDTSVAGIVDGLNDAGDPRDMLELYLDFSAAMLLRDPDFEEGKYGMPAGGPTLDPRANSFTDAVLTGIGQTIDPTLDDQVTSLTARFVQLESFFADSIYVKVTGPASLAARAILGFDAAGADPLDLDPVAVLDLETVAVEGGDYVREVLLEEIGGAADRVLVVTSQIDPARPGAGVADYTVTVAGDASEPGSCLSLLRVGPNPVDFSDGGSVEVSFFGDAPGPHCARIALYDAAGRSVRRLDAPPFQWDGTNDSGRGVAGGIYFWVASGDDEIRRGTLALIR